MRLTLERDRETIQRYAHIRPVPPWGGPPCGAQLPGGARKCSRARGHRGPHVCHGPFRKVLAVWDGDAARVATPSGRKAPAPRKRGEVWTGGMSEAVEAFLQGVARITPSMETFALFVLFVGFLAFAVDWFLKILG